MAKSFGNTANNDSWSSHNVYKDEEEEEKDVDDFCFLNSPRQGSSGYMLGGQQNSEWDQRRQALLDERRRIEERTLQSSNAALGTLYETEQIGVATAEELMRQGESLKKIEYNVDDVNSTLRTSQKHITSMKSIFGGIKSYFSRGNTEPTVRVAPSNEEDDGSSSKLRHVVNSSRDSTATTARDAFTHPGLRLRGIDTSGFSSVMDDTYQPQTSPDDQYSQLSQEVDKCLDRNLDEMSLGIGRLKNLARGLGEEITEQNETLDRLTGKMDRTENTLQHQNRQIARILKK